MKQVPRGTCYVNNKAAPLGLLEKIRSKGVMIAPAGEKAGRGFRLHLALLERDHRAQ